MPPSWGTSTHPIYPLFFSRVFNPQLFFVSFFPLSPAIVFSLPSLHNSPSPTTIPFRIPKEYKILVFIWDNKYADELLSQQDGSLQSHKFH